MSTTATRLPTGPLKAEIRRYLKKWGLDIDVASTARPPGVSAASRTATTPASR